MKYRESTDENLRVLYRILMRGVKPSSCDKAYTRATLKEARAEAAKIKGSILQYQTDINFYLDAYDKGLLDIV